MKQNDLEQLLKKFVAHINEKPEFYDCFRYYALTGKVELQFRDAFAYWLYSSENMICFRDAVVRGSDSTCKADMQIFAWDNASERIKDLQYILEFKMCCQFDVGTRKGKDYENVLKSQVSNWKKKKRSNNISSTVGIYGIMLTLGFDRERFDAKERELVGSKTFLGKFTGTPKATRNGDICKKGPLCLTFGDGYLDIRVLPDE